MDSLGSRDSLKDDWLGIAGGLFAEETARCFAFFFSNRFAETIPRSFDSLEMTENGPPKVDA